MKLINTMESSSEAAGKETVRIKIVGPSEGKLLTAVPIPEGDLKAHPIPEGDLKTQPFPEGDLKAQPFPEGDLKTQPIPEGDLKAQPFPEGDLKAQPFPEGDLKTHPFPEGDLKAQPFPEGDLKAQPFPEGDLKTHPIPEGDLKAQPFPEGDLKTHPIPEGDLKAQPFPEGDLKAHPIPEGDLKAQPFPEGDLKAQPFPEGDLKAQPIPEGDLKAQPFPEVERDIPAYLKKYYDYKADALGPGCLKVISQHLNCPAVGFSQYNLPKDWTGMAECLGGYSYHDLQDFERNPNPTEALLSDWKTRSGSTIKQLLECIHDIGRFDLLEGDRLYKTLEISVRNYEQSLRKIVDECPPPWPAAALDRAPSYPHIRELDQPLVVGDDRSRREFHAFVCYTYADRDFVMKMVDELEVRRGLKLCINARDLLGGGSKYVVTAELIENRCKRMVAVLSENFVNDGREDGPECDFQLRFAQSLSPGAHQNILIPITIDKCKVPSFLNHVSCLPYGRDEFERTCFWSRLEASLWRPAGDVEYENREVFRGLCLNLDPATTVNREDLKGEPDQGEPGGGTGGQSSCTVHTGESSHSSSKLKVSSKSSASVAIRVVPESSSSSGTTGGASAEGSSKYQSSQNSSPTVTVRISPSQSSQNSSPTGTVRISPSQSSKPVSSPQKTKINKFVNIFKKKKNDG